MEDDDLKLLPRPKRALTAYNYFFHYLRAKLLSGEVLDDSEGEVNDDNVEEALSQDEDPGEIRVKSRSGTQQEAKRGSAVKGCNGEVKTLRQRE